MQVFKYVWLYMTYDFRFQKNSYLDISTKKISVKAGA